MSRIDDEAQRRAAEEAPPPLCDPKIASAVVLVPVWLTTYYCWSKGYLSKDWGTAIDFAASVLPFAYFRHLSEKHQAALARLKLELTEQEEQRSGPRP
jgi:hypothetical protein